MLTVEQFEPLVEDCQRIKDQCCRDPDAQLRTMSEKAFNETFIGQRHALLAARKLFEAGMARTYAAQLSAQPGYGRAAERERVRAANLEQQARNHARASEQCQERGDQLESETLIVLQRRARQAQPPQVAAPQQPAAAPAAAVPHVHRRQREHPAGDDGDGE